MPSAHESRFRGNQDRVRGLVNLYQEMTNESPGRASVHESDLLRAAIVLLHASLEDLVRGLAAERLPHASPDVLASIPIVTRPGGMAASKITLGDLAASRGRSVDDVISESVGAFLERSNYNHPGEIIESLKGIGLVIRIDRSLRARIAAMMSRRHHIAHRLDRNEALGRGQHRARSLSKSTVEDWIDAVDRLGQTILAELGPSGQAQRSLP